MGPSNPDPIFTVIGEFQARRVLAAHAWCKQHDVDQARAEAALLSTRATTPDGLRAGMCFRIELLSWLLDDAENEAADLIWTVLRMAAEGRPVARALAALLAVVEPGLCTGLLHAALRDALELEQGRNRPAQRGRGAVPNVAAS